MARFLRVCGNAYRCGVENIGGGVRCCKFAYIVLFAYEAGGLWKVLAAGE